MRVISRALLLAAAAVFATGALAAGAPAAAKGPRTKDGKPDLNGIWQALNSANFDLEPHAARAALAMVPGQFVPVPAPEVVKMGAVGSVPAGLGVVEGDTIPYLPAALEKKKDNQKNWLTSDPEIKCYLPGVPRANYMPYPFQIFQSKDYVFIAYEYAGAVRNIYMKDPGAPPADSWMGQSVGKWEGDTLVVDSIGFKDATWMDGVGHPHSEELRVIERMQRVDPETLRIDFTFEDPIAYTHPWTSTLTAKLVHDGKMTETVTTMSDELHYRERFLNQKPTIPIRR